MTLSDLTVREMLDAVNAFIPGTSLVGGAVRNHLMGIPIKDFDFTTHWTPEEMEFMLREAGRRPIMSASRFGTVRFKVPVRDTFELVEVTTFRSDGPGRHPEVTFGGSLHDDLARRDFTMNAIAMTPNGAIMDPFHGADDIDTQTIRAVGTPKQRFREDPLRILRMFRFAAQLDFGIDPETLFAAEDTIHRLHMVARERWVDELDRILMAPGVVHVLPWLWRSGAFKFMLPELHAQWEFDQHSPFHSFELHMHTTLVVARSPEDVDIRWAALLHDVGKVASAEWHPKQTGRLIFPKHEMIGAEIAEGIALRLKFSKARREFIHATILNHLHEFSVLKAADNAAKG